MYDTHPGCTRLWSCTLFLRSSAPGGSVQIRALLLAFARKLFFLVSFLLIRKNLLLLSWGYRGRLLHDRCLLLNSQRRWAYGMGAFCRFHVKALISQTPKLPKINHRNVSVTCACSPVGISDSINNTNAQLMKVRIAAQYYKYINHSND